MTQGRILMAGAALCVLVLLATAAGAGLISVQGQITAIQGKGRTLTVRTDRADLNLVTDAATLVTLRGIEKSPAELKLGNTVRVKYASVHGRNMAAEISIETD